MITTGDARNILFSACKGVGIKDMHTSWAIPEGKVNRERIVVITPPEQTSDTYWENCFVAVNLCVPDIKGEANLKRLDELERAAAEGTHGFLCVRSPGRGITSVGLSPKGGELS